MIELLEQFAIVFFAVALAEFGDKTQLAVLALSTRYKKPAQIIAGAFLAFFAASSLAVIVGTLAGASLPRSLIKTASGLVFIAFGLYLLFEKEKEAKTRVKDGKSVFLASAALIFVMEIGDKTNLANVFFAAVYTPLLVLAAAVCAEVFLSALAVFFAKALFGKISAEKTRMASAILFILIGVASLLLQS